MDHEYDAQSEENEAEKTQGEGVESQPNGPSAAHFREAARLAAARARKALEQDEPQSPTTTTTVVAEDFKRAASRHARSVSGRGKIADMKKPKKSAQTEPMATEKDASGADESIAMLDERLHLGARMLRAFESQIQRLEDAGATETHDTNTFEDAARIEEACTRLEESLVRATEVEERLTSLISRAEDVAAGMGNGIEICNAIQAGTQDRAREIAELESAQQQRSDALIERTQAVLTRMEETLRRIEVMDGPLERSEDELAKPETPAVTLKQDPPVIEIHARTASKQTPAQHDATEPPHETPTASEPAHDSSAGTLDEDDLAETTEDSNEQFSLGTLSVEPGRAHRGNQTP